MLKNCVKCDRGFESDGELECLNCRIVNHDLYNRKSDFCKNVKAWNKMAHESNHKIAISNKYATKPILRHSKRVVSSDLSIHSSEF